MRNLVVSKSENHNLRCKTGKNIELKFIRKKKHSFIADTKLQVDHGELYGEIWRKSSISHNLFKNQIILKV